jgi:hypothetical protein
LLLQKNGAFTVGIAAKKPICPKEGQNKAKGCYVLGSKLFSRMIASKRSTSAWLVCTCVLILANGIDNE